MGMRLGNIDKLAPIFAGAVLGSPPNISNQERCRPAMLLNTNKGQAMEMPSRWSVTGFCCLQSAARFFTFFKVFGILTFSIQNPMARDPSTAHSYGILILVVAYHGPSDASEPLFTSDIQYRYRPSLDLRRKKAWQHTELTNTALCDRMRWTGHSDRSAWYAG